ncbi:hypothetical protein RhiLY_00300 [Ceratobasidium sp. AG-Ba]|nr:hypothetical protein RhiLY_00300 [Ceratobasidium sp. AG-Ba]
MRTRHPSNTNNPDQEAARVFEATLKHHVQDHPECQWELDWFKHCLKKVRRSRRLIDEHLAKSDRPFCDAFARQLTRSPAHLDLDLELTSPRSSVLLDHLAEEHLADTSASDFVGDTSDLLERPRPGSLSPQSRSLNGAHDPLLTTCPVSPRAAIPGTPYDEPPSATASVAPTPKVPGAFFASVQSLPLSHGSSPAMRPDVIEPGPPPEPLPSSDSLGRTNVPDMWLAPDDATPRFERPSPLDQPEIPRVHSVSPHTSFPGDVPNADAFPIYSNAPGDVPLEANDDRRPNPLRLPGAYAASQQSMTPSQSVEDVTTPVDTKTPTETPITPGLELDLFPKPPSSGLPTALTVPPLNLPSASSAVPISPQVPGAYAPSIFDATPAMGTVPLEPLSPSPFEDTHHPVLDHTVSHDVPPSPSEDESTTPVREQVPIPRPYNPILAGQTTDRASRSFPIDETALDGHTPTTEPNSPLVLVPNVERSVPQPDGPTPDEPEAASAVSPSESWHHVSPPSDHLDTVSSSDTVERDQAVAPDNDQPAGEHTEISPASVSVVDVPTQAQDKAQPVQAVASVPERVLAEAPVDTKSELADADVAVQTEQASSEPKLELPVEEPAPTVDEAPSAQVDDSARPPSSVIADGSEPTFISEVEPHSAPHVDTVPESNPSVVEQDEPATTISDSVPRPELDSATLAEPEVIRAGDVSVAEGEPALVPEEHESAGQPVAEDISVPEVATSDIPVTIAVPSVPTQEPTETVSIPEQAGNAQDAAETRSVLEPELPLASDPEQAVPLHEPVKVSVEALSTQEPEQVKHSQDATDTRSLLEPDNLPTSDPEQEALPKKHESLDTVAHVPSSQPGTDSSKALLPGASASDVVEIEPVVQTTAPEPTLASGMVDEVPAVHVADTLPAQEPAKEVEQTASIAAPESVPDVLPSQPVVEAAEAPTTGSTEPSVEAESSPEDQSVQAGALAHVTSSTEPVDTIHPPHEPTDSTSAPLAPLVDRSIAANEHASEVVVEPRETLTLDSNSMHQPGVVPDIQLPSPEVTKLGASANVGPQTDDHVESAHDSDSTADTDSIRTPPATVDGSAVNPAVRAKELSQAAGKLSEKFATYGDVDNLDDAIEMYGRAAELLAPNSDVLDVRSYLDLGRMMRVKFETFNDITDLDSAINDSLLKAHDMVKSNPGHELYSDVLYELGTASLNRYLYDASTPAGNDALRYCEEALKSSAGSKRAAVHSVLSRFHLARFEYLSAGQDAEKALEHLDAAADAHRAVEREPKYIESRARALFACYQTGRAQYNDHLDQALVLAQEALDRTLAGSINYPITSTFLAEVLLARYERSHNPSDLDTALELLEGAVQEVPYVSPDQPWVGERLARALIARFIHGGTTEDLDDAIAFLEIALNLTVSNPYRRRPRLDAFGGALTLRFRHYALGQSDASDRLREARELMVGGSSM